MKDIDDITVYKYMFLKYLCKKLNLNEIEKEISKNRIIPYQNRLQNESLKYFTLLNEGNFETFTDDEKKKFYKLINDNDSEQESENFIEKTYKKFFFSDITQQYSYYGKISNEYMAPSDAIVLGICYEKYGKEKSSKDIEISEMFLCDLINKIQFSLAPSKNMKIAIIKYDELAINRPSVYLK